MKRSIAILTQYYLNSNYGGLLQAYALQKYLQNNGYEAKQISYIHDSGNSGYEYRKMKESIKTLIKVLINQQWHKKHSAYEKKLFEFAEMIPHTEVLKASQLSCLNNRFDTFIVGSDQVWNPIGWQPTMFFDFLDPNKFCMSYAASIARYELTNSELKFIKQYIDKFNYISIREEGLVTILEENIGKSVDVMPDPTFLLTLEEWMQITPDRIVKENYIFAYFLGNNLKQREEAKVYANSHGLKIIFIPYMNKDWFEWDLNNTDNVMEGVGVPEFLSLIKYAECVITDSFHGTIFSLLFGVPFFTMKRFTNSDKQSMNSRIDTLLKSFNMQERYADEIPALIGGYNVKEVNDQIIGLRTKGSDYLLRCLKSGIN